MVSGRGTPDDRLPVSLLLTVGKNGSPLPLTDWMAWVTGEITRMQNELHQLKESVHQLRQGAHAEPPAAAQAREALRQGQVDLAARFDDLDARFGNVLARFAEPPGEPGLARTEAEMAHHDFAQEYRGFVDQEVVALARSMASTPRDKAVRAADLCVALFGSVAVNEQAVLDVLAAASDTDRSKAIDLCRRVEEFRAKISGDRPQGWSFDAELGVPIQPHQEPWQGSGEGSVEFVVAPAYLVDGGTVLCPQRVFLAPEQYANHQM